ncbi:iron-sulfur cluster-binding protein [Geotalea daltonii FRC-32]|uniref:Iron-sulfur cluster-binding protein n=1 Tax=Geotalea daltonii (strain DSM 22248 / JCM 15807 / FRC-32) TaxID=316067 RepID=B9M8T1_GEODF|nr:4Fe-4S binding protein [Geotalea daltonii]ACM20427.1 iron-sulfur cluster-binding protein [Geotalea daltonii FRC-32]
MCEFCLKHGEGEKWYLQAKNYSEDLLSDLRRRRFMEHFADPEQFGPQTNRSVQRLERLHRLPWFIRNVVGRLVTRRMKKQHFGQVVPIEEIEQIFQFTNSVVRVACICRQNTVGKEKRYCYGISMGPDGGKALEIFQGVDGSFYGGPADDKHEILTKEEALAAMRAHELEGLCHTVWTFQTPFIGGICNCDRTDCLAMRATVTHDVPVMFRAEYVAEIDPESCSGCRQCMRLCQFGALGYSASNKKAVVDQTHCYGCGICRSACKTNAISLDDRAKSPVAAHLW